MNPLTLEGVNREKQRRKMIEDALETRNPILYRQLKKDNNLQEFLKDREQEMMQAYRAGRSQVVLHDVQGNNAKDNPLEQAKEIDSRLRILWESILETYLDFGQREATT